MAMISETDARQRVAERTAPLPAGQVPLDQALGRVLAEDVVSDIDSPPHDKALVDGYAVVSSDFQSAGDETVTHLRVLEEVTAGRNPTRELSSGSAVRIMTGAPLPAGCDAVIMIEQSEIEGDQVALKGTAVPEQHLMRRATSVRTGDVVARAGQVIRAVETGVLAEVGVTEPTVSARPTVAVLSTGDELVPADQRPRLGQIRNSNGPMLAAQVRQAGGEPVALGIAGDDANTLRERIDQGLQSDVLVLSGGVSAGVLDLVPPTLRHCQVEEVFHKVLIKPGKPIWFGVGPTGTLVFGLPGNPVGSLVCFERFVKPALHALQGRGEPFRDDTFAARLTEQFSHRGPRPTYRPARLNDHHDVTPIAWHGSADLRALADANCLIAFEPGDAVYDAGAEVRCVRL